MESEIEYLQSYWLNTMQNNLSERTFQKNVSNYYHVGMSYLEQY